MHKVLLMPNCLSFGVQEWEDKAVTGAFPAPGSQQSPLPQEFQQQTHSLSLWSSHLHSHQTREWSLPLLTPQQLQHYLVWGNCPERSCGWFFIDYCCYWDNILGRFCCSDDAGRVNPPGQEIRCCSSCCSHSRRAARDDPRASLPAETQTQPWA